MRISPEVVARLHNILVSRLEANQRAGASTQPEALNGEQETVALSAELRLIQLLHEMVKQIPEVDGEQVAQIRQQLEQGTYNPDTKAVAEAILRELGV